MSILPLPAGVVDRIHSICRSFMWTSKNPPIAWSAVCGPKAEGGLGLRDLTSWNLALLAKVLWRIQDRQDTLWIRWVHSTYLQQEGIWTWQARHADSPLIKKLLHIRDRVLTAAGTAETAAQTLHAWFSERKEGVQRAYDYFREKRARKPWVKTVWQKCIQPSHAFTLWLLSHGRLPARARQEYMEDRLCTFCRQEEETLDHVFFRCGSVCQLWGRVRAWLQMRPEMTTYRSMLRTFRQRYRVSTVITRARHIAMSALVHLVWRARNASMFEGLRLDTEMLFRKIQTHVYRSLGIFTDQAIRQG